MYIWGLSLIAISLKKKFTFLLLYNTLFPITQVKKHQSLLWEISGNDLPNKSYLYRSMHVSDKISYHLSYDFFLPIF